MKKLFVILVVLAFVGTLAHAASSAGYIDVQKVFKGYKETNKAQEQLAKEEEAFKKEFDESQKKLEKAQKEGKKTEELDQMKKDLETTLSPKRESLLKLNEQLTGKLQLDILEAVKKVAKKVGLDLVLDKQVVITGGIDLTEMVLNELNP